jgi:ubiquinone/menaquinone biosynthesis C-methylase UbiE
MSSYSFHVKSKGSYFPIQRIPETEDEGEFDYTHTYDQMMRRLRDMGLLQIELILEKRMTKGLALEIGPGPGYIGLEWLKHTSNTRLKGLDISLEMIEIASRNAAEYSLTDRVEYRKGNGSEIPFDDHSFDVVFTFQSLHEWSEPEKTFDEIERVLRVGGKYLIYDLRRDIFPIIKSLMLSNTLPEEIRPKLIASINASYVEDEIQAILKRTRLWDSMIQKNLTGIVVSGSKRQ